MKITLNGIPFPPADRYVFVVDVSDGDAGMGPVELRIEGGCLRIERIEITGDGRLPYLKIGTPTIVELIGGKSNPDAVSPGDGKGHLVEGQATGSGSSTAGCSTGGSSWTGVASGAVEVTGSRLPGGRTPRKLRSTYL